MSIKVVRVRLTLWLSSGLQKKEFDQQSLKQQTNDFLIKQTNKILPKFNIWISRNA